MKTFDRYLEYFLAILMAIMLASVSWQVMTRYFLGISTSVTDELARYLLIWIGTLGAAYASGQRLHLSIDLIPSKLEGKARYRLDVVINILVIVFAVAVMIIGGSRLVYVTYSLGQISAAMQIPLAYVYMIIPFSGALITVYKIRDLMILRKDPTSLHSQENPS